MSNVISHPGVVTRIDGDTALVTVDTGGCSSCGHSGGCGIGKLAEGRPATVLRLPAAGMTAGDRVDVGLSSTELARSALIGYLLPAFAMLCGAGLGMLLAGSDGAAALGAALAFVAALLASRWLPRWLPGLLPAPRLIPVTQALKPEQEIRHD